MRSTGLFRKRSQLRSQGVHFLMVFCLLFVTVQPWKLPIPFMEKKALIEITQSGLGLPANEEESHADKQSSEEGSIIHNILIVLVLPNNGGNEIPPSPFFEVPTPPPRG